METLIIRRQKCHGENVGNTKKRAATRETWSSEFPTRSNTNRSVQSQKKARSLKFWILEEEKLYYPSSENKGADQLCSYCTADLRLCFRFSHDAAHILLIRSQWRLLAVQRMKYRQSDTSRRRDNVGSMGITSVKSYCLMRKQAFCKALNISKF